MNTLFGRNSNLKNPAIYSSQRRWCCPADNTLHVCGSICVVCVEAFVVAVVVVVDVVMVVIDIVGVIIGGPPNELGMVFGRDGAPEAVRNVETYNTNLSEFSLERLVAEDRRSESEPVEAHLLSLRRLQVLALYLLQA